MLLADSKEEGRTNLEDGVFLFAPSCSLGGRFFKEGNGLIEHGYSQIRIIDTVAFFT